MELIKPSLVFKQHLEEPSPSLQHFVKPVVQSQFQRPLVKVWLVFLRVLFVPVLVLSIPHVMGDELFNLGLLLVGEVLFVDSIRAERFHKSCYVFY